MSLRKRVRRGFTMVEMLTVIAIIAILAAIIFPVLGPLRRNVAKSSCLTNLRTIAQAIKMYKDDYRIYPEALYGYVPLDANGNPKPRLVLAVDPATGKLLLVLAVDPATGKQLLEQRTFLYPQYITNRSTLLCPMNLQERSTDTTDTTKLLVGVNGVTGQKLDVQPSIQHYGRAYFTWDSYDGTVVPVSGTQNQYRVHYMRRWWDPVAVGGAESPRELIYRYPPDSTVVTWCTYHRDAGPGNSLQSGSVDLVLFLDGRAKAVPSNLMVVRSDQDVRTQTDVPAHVVAPGS